ncbi:MAG: SMP-30/gluconolactonase/LRE family protein [Alphaproteobacteria bacterium]|nr:SMP-30/gluconolactonase/LRE family protein [Alphaproteobacteria bacterium]
MWTVDCVAPTSCLLGSGPIWSPTEGLLWWVDLKRAKLHRYNPKTGNTRRYDLPVHASAMVMSKGRLLMVADREYGFYDPETEDYARLGKIADEPVGNRTNDGGISPDGSFWFATMDNGEKLERSRYLRLDPASSTCHVLPFKPVRVPNSIVFSPDGSKFYTCDTAGQTILSYDRAPTTGALSNPSVFAETITAGCYPGGSAIDAEGGLWNAQWAGSRLVRYLPDGKIDQVVDLPVSRPTACAFGGDDMKTLFITTARQGLSEAAMNRQPLAGCLFAIRVSTPGLALGEWGEGATGSN